MVNENQLEETNDSIIPVKNGLGLPSEMFAEILREFDRACISKNIDNKELINYLATKSSWKIKCIAMGSVSNVIIAMGNDSDQHLGTLKDLGEDLVVDEIIRVLVDAPEARASAQKKSTNKIPIAKPSASSKKKEAVGSISSSLEYHSAKPKSNVLILSVSAILGVMLVIGGYFLFQKSNSKTSTAPTKPVESIAPVVIEPKVPEKEVVVKEVPKTIIKPVEPKKETPTVLPFAGKMIPPEGSVVFQAGKESFNGGDMVTLYSQKRKSTSSPFTVSNNLAVSYILMKYDLRNVPADAIIEKAILSLHITTRGESNEIFVLNCLPLNLEWNSNSIFFAKEGSSTEISYAGLIKKKVSAERISMNMRSDWVSFNVTLIVQDWLSKKAINNGFALFTETNSEIVLEGFDSSRVNLTPKLSLTFGLPGSKPADQIKSTESNSLIDPKTPDKKPENIEEKDPALITSKPSKKDKDIEEGDDASAIFKNFPKKPDGEKTNETTLEKAKEANAFEEDTSTVKKKEEIATEVKAKAPIIEKEKKPETIEIPKDEGEVDIVFKEPVILPLSRLIEATDVVKFENPDNKGDLRYTIDGKDPTPDSLIYKDPIKLSGNQLHLVKTAVFVERTRKSPIKSHEFRISNSLGQIIDNTSSRCKQTGDWVSGNSKSNAYGKDYVWEQKGKGFVEWVPSIIKKSNIEVYIWIPDGDLTRPAKAKYVITYDGGKKEVFVDQTKRDNGWIYLGVYPMKSGAGSITLFDDGQSFFVADAAYFYLVPDSKTPGN